MQTPRFQCTYHPIGLKAVLLQANGDNDILNPVFYISRTTLTEVECQYAHIEKRHWQPHGHMKFWQNTS